MAAGGFSREKGIAHRDQEIKRGRRKRLEDEGGCELRPYAF